MGNYGNVSGIIDAEKEQSRMVKRHGKCEHCHTQINTNLLKDEDIKNFVNLGKIIACPICHCGISMESI